jgi:hypothetical protein
MAYRIHDWDEYFENHRTRELGLMRWVPVPNKHDGDSFVELLSHPNGMAHYGAWVLLLQVASKCNPRGFLVRSTGEFHNVDTLAKLTHGSKEVFVEALPRLVSIGWLDTQDQNGDWVNVGGCPRKNGACPRTVRRKAAKKRGQVTMEVKGMEGNGNTTPTPIDEVEEIWQAYPKHRRVNKAKAAEHIKAAITKHGYAALLAAVQQYTTAVAAWPAEDQQFVPHPERFFRDERFLDDPASWLRGGTTLFNAEEADMERELRAAKKSLQGGIPF